MREVPGSNGMYKIDIDGEEVKCWSKYSNKYLSNRPYSHTGYVNWMLYGINGETVFQQAGRWVALTFPELVQNEYFEGAEIDHIDTDRTNNHPFNLRWVNKQEQMNNPLTKKHQSNTLRNRTDQSKEVIQRTLKGEFVARYQSSQEAARQTGIDGGNIRNACLHKSYTDKYGKTHTIKSAGGYLWSYE